MHEEARNGQLAKNCVGRTATGSGAMQLDQPRTEPSFATASRPPRRGAERQRPVGLHQLSMTRDLKPAVKSVAALSHGIKDHRMAGLVAVSRHWCSSSSIAAICKSIFYLGAQSGWETAMQVARVVSWGMRIALPAPIVSPTKAGVNRVSPRLFLNGTPAWSAFAIFDAGTIVKKT